MEIIVYKSKKILELWVDGQLKESYPKMEICIASVPMNKKNSDITDYLDICDDRPSGLLDILAKEKPVDDPTSLNLLCFENIVEQEIKWHIPKGTPLCLILLLILLRKIFFLILFRRK